MDELHMTNLEDSKFASPINCHIAHVVDDPSGGLKSSPNPTLSQLTTANCHMEMEEHGGSTIKNEEASSTFAMPFMH